MMELLTVWKVVLFATILKVATAHLTWATRQQWDNFKLEYNKIYNSLYEEEYRLSVFLDNLKEIRQHNLLYKMGLTSYYKGVNHLTDLTDEEYIETYLMPINNRGSIKPICSEAIFNARETEYPAPRILDWRRIGAVTPVRDQMKCGCCYAFSSLGALEAQFYLTTKKLTALSPQNIIECSSIYPFKNRRCLYGRPDEVFRYIIHNKGVDTEQSYPYISGSGREVPKTCHYNESAVGARMTRCAQIQVGNETALKMAVAKWGPVAVIVDSAGMKLYSGGIYDNVHCNPKPVQGHSMLIVGYGTYRKHDYWLLKSSWGTTWGENGYIMMTRNKRNQCGIATTAYIPFVE